MQRNSATCPSLVSHLVIGAVAALAFTAAGSLAQQPNASAPSDAAAAADQPAAGAAGEKPKSPPKPAQPVGKPAEKPPGKVQPKPKPTAAKERPQAKPARAAQPPAAGPKPAAKPPAPASPPANPQQQQKPKSEQPPAAKPGTQKLPAAKPPQQKPAKAQPAAKPQPPQKKKAPPPAARPSAKGGAKPGAKQEAPPKTRPANPPAAQPPAAQLDRNQRLERIEKTLQTLLQEVQQLRREEQAKPPGKAATETAAATPQPKGILPESWLKTVTWRSIGPANMGGRIVDLAVNPKDPCMFWVATASGGLLKTTNNGITFEHQFDRENTVSIGAVAVAPSDPNIVWVGTGENNPRNSVSYGDGVYKSTDGGKTWKHMGLQRSFQIGRIVIHPTNPDIVYVGVLGRLYGPNPERGLFKTTDGGKTWEKVLYVDDKTGVIDLVMHPTDPQTLIAATWQRRRDGYDSWPGNQVPIPDGYNRYDPVVKWGPGSGLYKTTDGGKTWKRLTQGLPSCNLGRIGLDWYRKDPNVVFAIVDCEQIGKGPPPLQVYLGVVGRDAGGAAELYQVIPDSPAAKAGVKVGDRLLAVDEKPIGGFDQVLDAIRKRKPGDKVKLKIARGDKQQEIEVALSARPGSPAASAIWLGVTGEDYQGHARLTRIVPDSPAANAGLQTGDVIVQLDKTPVESYEQLIQRIRSHKAGDQVKVKVMRGQATHELTVTLANRPGRGRPASNAYLGVQGTDVEQGAQLLQVTPDSPAAKAGLKPNDVVRRVEDKSIGSYDDLVAQIRARKPGDKMKLTVQRGKELLTIVVTLGDRTTFTGARPYSYSLGGQRPNAQDQQGANGFQYGGVYKSTDGGQTWTRINSLHSRPMYFSVIRVDPGDDNYVYVLGVAQFKSTNGGITFTGDLGRGVHADGHALWIDPRDGRHMIIGTDGGTYVTYDRGAHWDHLNHTAIGQFYHVAISPKQPYHVTGGLQDNGTWFGPSLTRDGSGPINADWLAVGGGDGFMCRVDPEDPDLVYSTSQDGNMRRRNLRTGESARIRPRQPSGAPPYRFNWNTPFILSHHNSRIFYCAGNVVFRSLNRGDHLQPISPDITRTKRGSATALSESPRDPNVLYVGTDDGLLWVTRDGGRSWKEISPLATPLENSKRPVPEGLPGPRWVATIEASRFADGRVYVAFDGHRSDDDNPYVYVSEDFGQTWTSIRANLPWGSTRCLREDVQNPNLLLVGTEFGVWVSIDRGRWWNKLNTNLPTVAVHEIAIHPDNGEIVAATHGRSLWICDISALRQITLENLTDKIALYQPPPVVRWMPQPRRGSTNRRFTGTNPPPGASIYYSLPKKAKEVALRIVDVQGRTIRELRGSGEPGLHRARWDLRQVVPTGQQPGRSAPKAARSEQPRQVEQPPSGAAAAARSEQPGAQGPRPPTAAGQRPTRPARAAGSRSRGPAAQPRPVPPGTYRVVLAVDGQQFTQTIEIQRDPAAPPDAVANYWELEQQEEEEEEEELREQETDTGRWIDD